MASWTAAVRKTRPVGSQSSARIGQLACLGPAAQQVQRLGHVAAQEVAVDGLQAGRPGILDPEVRDLDRLGPSTDEVQHGGQVGRDPEQRVRVAEGPGATLRLAQQLDGALRVAAPGHRHPERGGGVDILGERDGIARPRDADRLTGEALRFGERAVEHLDLGQAGDDGRPFRRIPTRDELDGSTGRLGGALRIARRPKDVGEPILQQAEANPIPAPVQGAHRRLQVGGRPRRPTDGEGRFGGPDL